MGLSQGYFFIVTTHPPLWSQTVRVNQAKRIQRN